jgi:hypothetical protein
VDALRALERHLGWLQALQFRVLAALDHDPFDSTGLPDRVADREVAVRSTREEVACALRVSGNTAANKLCAAGVLVQRFPSTLGLLQQGEVQLMQALAVVEVTATLEPEVAQRVEAAVVGRMPVQAVAATRKALHRAVLRADPLGASERHAVARAERRVCHQAAQDGMAWWSAFVPVEQAARMDAALDTRAIALKALDDGRSLDQRRADALVDLVCAVVPLNGTASAADAVQVQVTVDFETLIGVAELPGEVRGYGPVTAAQARALAVGPGSVWRRFVTAPDGRVLHVDASTYRPTADVQRLVLARDVVCTFPSCQMPAQRCDLDHIRPFDHGWPERGGPSTPDNLHPLCRAHHRLKHEAGWTPVRDQATGATTWTSPTHHVYSSTPPVLVA